MFKIAKTLLIAVLINPIIGWAQNTPIDEINPIKPEMKFYGTSSTVSYLAQNPINVALGMGQFQEDHVEELYEEPYTPLTEPLPQFIQTEVTQSLTAIAGTSFEGPGVGLAGFSLTGAPPDHTLAVGPDHIVAMVNSQMVIFDKSGNVLVSPININSLFTGVGGVCETTNRGDPILQYDRLADRWILSQFAFSVSGGAPVAPYFQCFAVSTSADPTSTYVRYTVQFSSTSPNGFNDYGKLGVWPDAYYTSYNIFGGSPAGSNTGAALCASDRVKMLAGDASATTLCSPVGFYGGGASFLPADLDGITLPSDLTQGGIFMRASTSQNLRYLKLKPNFAAGTVTLTDGFGGANASFVSLPTTILYACNGSGGTCVSQPGTANLLDTLGSRLMYRLAFRNRDGVESLLVSHATDPDAGGAQVAAMRWYEIRNPLGNPIDANLANRPFIYQSGTYNPGASGNRWMGSIAMDKNGNILMGYNVVNTGTGLKPSIAVAGRELNDPLNTLQSEIIAHTGTGSQTDTLTRWGDYSTMQVDPVDDLTFWYIGQYLSADGTFNWRTRIVSYKFPEPATLSIDDVNIVEGNSATSIATFTITRSHADDEVSVEVDTLDDTAIAGSDYNPFNQTIVMAAGGSTTAEIDIEILGDEVLELDEDFAVVLSNPSGATIENDTGIGVIENDDSASLSIDDVTGLEGNGGTTDFVFNVTLSGTVPGGFTVPFTTNDGTASNLDDYSGISGGFIFFGNDGEVKTITVAVTGDNALESDEDFTVTLSTPSNPAVTFTDSEGLGTIVNDDVVSISINDVTANEGDSGNTNFEFTVTLTGEVPGGFTVPFSTSDGSASEGNDYTSASGELTFTGTDNETHTIFVSVLGDGDLESDEGFTVNLGTPSNAGVSVSDGDGVGAIINDDSASLSIDDVTGIEGNSSSTDFVFNVTLTGSVPGGFTLPYSTNDGTALSLNDYAGISGAIGFSGTNNETKTITVAVSGDSILELDETFTVSLSTPSNPLVAFTDDEGLGTITNDDNVTLTINGATDDEGDSGNSNFQFSVLLTGEVQDGFAIDFSTEDDTATQPSDYISIIGTLNFSGSNNESQIVNVSVVGETEVEFDEEFKVNLSSPSISGISFINSQAIGQIINDDLEVDVDVAIVDNTELVLAGGTANYTVTVTNNSSILDVPVVNLTQTISTGLSGVTWTCIGTGTAVCPANGSGIINQAFAITKDSALVFEVTANVEDGLIPQVETTFSAEVVSPFSDTNVSNNTAQDSNFVDIFFNGFE